MRILCLAVTIMALMTTAMWAAPVPIFNTRPVAIGTEWPGEPSLQSIIDALWGAVAPDVDTQQNPWGMFKNSTVTPPGSSAATLYAEWTSGESSQGFGIFSPADDSTRVEQLIFKGAATPGGAMGSALLAWDLTGTLLTVIGDPTYVNTGVNIPISMYNFGFFFVNGAGAMSYTVDALTPGEPTPRVLSFARLGTDPTEYAFAYEDGSDFDYQDMVVKVESIQAVPEPASVVLLGTLMLGIGGLVRRRMTK